MSVVFDHRDPGTSEAEWIAAAPWRAAEPFDIAAERLLVLAAHPDDETLGAGGLLARAAAAGADITVIVATDGEASHPDASSEPARRTLRRIETIAALGELAPGAGVRFLGLPDGGLREAAVELAAALEREVGSSPSGLLVVAPWWGDGHRDHRVLGEAALALRQPGVRVAGYPVWLWHWGDPASTPTNGWRVLPLAPAMVEAKARAIARHGSQTSAGIDPSTPPILHDGMTAHFVRDVEVFVEPEPARRASVPVEDFEGFYDRHDDPWDFASRWYEERRRALLTACLPRRRFAAGLELGCATGLLTVELAQRCERLVAVDAVESAVRATSARVDPASATVLRRTLPEEWPDGRFDLVVLAELGYYWSAQDLETALSRIDGCLADDGVLVACHWRHAIPGAPLTGDRVHSAIGRSGGWRRSVHHVEEDLLLDVFVRPDAVSVARAVGLA